MEATNKGKFLSAEGAAQAEQAKADTELRRRWEQVRDIGCLLAGDALLISMVLGDKIDLFYGLVFLAAASALFGYRMK